MCRNLSRVGLLAVGLLGLAATSGTVAQQVAPDEAARQTAAWVQTLRNDDGGYGATPEAESTLGATNSAIRALKYCGQELPEPEKTAAFVASCHRDEAGGFAQKPGAEADVATTAVGLMAATQLGMGLQPYEAGAIRYFHDHVATFEDVRIAVAGIEALGGLEDPEEATLWTRIVMEGRNPDGTWGEGPGQARATGSAAVALLRLAAPLNQRQAILATLRSGQRDDGGWGQAEGPSDLGSTYRVMRAFFMLNERPDASRLRAFLDRHRTESGGYAPTPGGTPDASSTYYASIVRHWLDELDAKAPVLVSIFNGTDLSGWQGDTSVWSVVDGAIVGRTETGLKQNEFLATEGVFGDFVLSLKFRIHGDESANSGIMFRAERVEGSSEMSGYQADIGQDFWGCLYDESRRNRVLVQASPEAAATVKRDDWNTYEIRAQGSRINLTLNGVRSVHYHEPDATLPAAGRIALQVHAGQPLTVEFRDIELKTIVHEHP
jgi:prenyltransferase beta subunit